jgi:hypothetical protein
MIYSLVRPFNRFVPLLFRLVSRVFIRSRFFSEYFWIANHRISLKLIHVIFRLIFRTSWLNRVADIHLELIIIID